MTIIGYLLLFRCERLPEDSQLDFYDYYAIDIGNSQPVIQFITDVRSLVKKHGIDSISTCEILDASVSIVEFPPCDPVTLKLQPICVTQCQTFTTIISQCFGDAVGRGITISEFAVVYSSYNCIDPSTHLPGVSGDLFDSQEQCYYVMNYALGKCVYNFLVFVVKLSSMKLIFLKFP